MHSRLIVLLAAVGLSSSMATAGVVPLTRDSLDKIEGQALTDSLDDSISFHQFAAFNDGVSKTGGNPPPGTRANADAGESSVIDISTPGVIKGNGTLGTSAFAAFGTDGNGGTLQVRATSELTVTFEIVDHSEPFHVKGSFLTQDIVGATSHFSIVGISPVSLGFSTDNLAGTIVGGGLDFEAMQILPVGTYKLFADSGSGSSGEFRGSEGGFGQTTGVNFDFTIGQPATAIPLPPALFPGLAALGGVLGGLTYRRRNS